MKDNELMIFNETKCHSKSKYFSLLEVLYIIEIE